MRKELFFLCTSLLIISFFIASCTPVPEYYVCKDGTRVKNAEECYVPVIPEPKEEVKQPEPKPKPVKKEISPAAQVYFDNNAKVSSLQYAYVESPATLPENFYYTTKEKMRIELKNMNRFSEKDVYDTVYLDLVNKTAVAYCENLNKDICHDRHKPFYVNFTYYYKPTPFDWLERIEKAELTGVTTIFAKRNAVEMMIEINGLQGKMLVDSFFGMPLYISYNGKIYEFRDIVMNEVNSSRLEHQFTP